MNRKIANFIYVLLPVLLSLFLLSCPSQISEDILLQAKDDIVPVITISSPQDGSPYSTVVEVTGTAKDCFSCDGAQGGIKSITYEVLATTIMGEILCNGDGSFCFDFSTSGLSGSLVVKITAVDWNDNSGNASITLIDTDSDISSFTATAENHKITIEWDPVPLAESYTLYYTTNNSYPNIGQGGTNGFVRENIQPGEELTQDEDGIQIQNGSMHMLQLKADLPNGYEDAWSGYIKAVPLSQLTLAPKASMELEGEIRLQWREIPTGVDYEVWRSETKNDEDFQNLTGAIDDPFYTDKAVEDGKVYYYKVKLESFSDVSSMPVPGQACTLFFDKITGSCELSVQAYDMAVNSDGNYIYAACGTEGLNIFNASVHSAPEPVDFDYPGNIRCIAVSGGYALVCAYTELVIFDVSTPQTPVFKNGIELTPYGMSSDIAVVTNDLGGDENFAYVIRNNNLYIVRIDLTSPEAPSLIKEGSCNVDGNSISVAGDYAYTIDSVSAEKKLHIYTVSAPDNPQYVADFDIDSDPNGITNDGNYLYMTCWQGLYIYDIAVTLEAPSETGYCSLPPSAKVEVAGERTYVSKPYRPFGSGHCRSRFTEGARTLCCFLERITCRFRKLCLHKGHKQHKDHKYRQSLLSSDNGNL